MVPKSVGGGQATLRGGVGVRASRVKPGRKGAFSWASYIPPGRRGFNATARKGGGQLSHPKFLEMSVGFSRS
jgi:hypothetical protein